MRDFAAVMKMATPVFIVNSRCQGKVWPTTTVMFKNQVISNIGTRQKWPPTWLFCKSIRLQRKGVAVGVAMGV